MKKTIVALFTVCMAFSFNYVYADNVGPGLGRVALEGKSGKVWELVGTFLNGICANGTFAITSGTLGYKEGAKIGLNAADVYIAENMDDLANDIAKGDGEYVDTLARIMKVDDRSAFKDTLHKNFNKIYTSKDVSAQEVAENIKKLYS